MLASAFVPLLHEREARWRRADRYPVLDSETHQVFSSLRDPTLLWLLARATRTRGTYRLTPSG